MHHLEETLKAHPRPQSIGADKIKGLIASLSACAHTCHACADACLGEEMIDNLRQCISLDLACAEICQATANLLTSQTSPDKALLKSVAQACEIACNHCGEECEKHASKHAHCDHCAKACRECAAQCQELGSVL